MSLRIRIRKKNIAIRVYVVLMPLLMVARYLFGIDVPSAAFLVVAVIPVFFGSTSELLACVMSYIPLSAAFQYKYAILIATAVLLLKNRWRLKSGVALLLVIVMMIWELLHVGFGFFSLVEYLRGFAELLFMGAVIMVDIGGLDHKMVIRALAVSVVGVCGVMFIMQMQQYNFNLLKVFSRSAATWRFGQSNMASGRFSLNFNANNLGFICNLSTCGLLLLRKRNENVKTDVILMLCSLFFALITLSRAAIVCMLMVIALYVFGGESRGLKRVIGILSVFGIVVIVAALIYKYVPAIYENLIERFRRADVWNGRGSLFEQYMKFLFMSPVHMLFGIGMQNIYEKALQVMMVRGVPHNGLQEVLVAWGIPGLVVMITWFVMLLRLSSVYSGRKRDFYQYVPLLLTLVFTMSGQLLTSSRALLALSFSYICLCIAGRLTEEDVKAA